MPNSEKLSLKQNQFIIAYLGEANGNATKAAIIAGYAPATARAQASRMLTNVNIQAEIRQFYAEKSMGAEEVVGRLAEQARGAGAYLQATEAGALAVDVNALLEDGKGHLIKGFKQTKFGQDIEFYDAQAALVQLGRTQGLFIDRQETKADVSISVYHELTDDELDERIKEIEGGEASPLPSDGPGRLREHSTRN